MSEFTCALCQNIYTKKNDDEWNDKKAAEEFLELTPECRNDATAIICDDCFVVYKEWLANQTDEDKRKMREDCQ